MYFLLFGPGSSVFTDGACGSSEKKGAAAVMLAFVLVVVDILRIEVRAIGCNRVAVRKKEAIAVRQETEKEGFSSFYMI